MRAPRIANFMVQADFGRTTLNRPALLLYSYTRHVMAALITLLVVGHLLATNVRGWLSVILLFYFTYNIALIWLAEHLADKFYTPHIQFWRAQFGILGVSVLLFVLSLQDDVGSSPPRLWGRY